MPDQLRIGDAPQPLELVDAATSASGTPEPAHESLQLFTPAPAVMPGQTSIGGIE